MNIKVNVKQIGSRRKGLAEQDFFLEDIPHTVGELIEYSVNTCVREYNERVRAGENSAKPISENDISEMSTVGKIAFGINYGGKEADIRKAVNDALLAYEDGLFRIFIGENEAGKTDENINIKENDSVTFIRLAMLAGGMF